MGEATDYAYDGVHLVRIQNNANGTKTRWCYDDPTGFLTGITQSAGSTQFAQYNLTYDNGQDTVGMLTSVSEADGSAASYAYDQLYCLAAESRSARRISPIGTTCGSAT